MSDTGVIGWFAANHVAANLLALFIIVMGAYSVAHLKAETHPAFDLDAIEVLVPYLGAAPAEVEEGVVVKVEEAVEAIEGIRETRSVAREGVGSITLEIDDDHDANEVMDEVKLAVDGIATFPVETERPIIRKAQWKRGAITVQVGGDLDEASMKLLADQIRNELIALPEVTFADVWGARPFEISIEVADATLRQYGLTLERVAQAVRNSSVDLPGGSIRTEAGDIRVRAKGQAYTGAQFRDIVLITAADGTRIRLGDIATIRDGFAETESYAFFNGKRSFGIAVSSGENDNEIEVADAVKAYVNERRTTLPSGVRIDVWADQTYYLKGRLDMMLRNMAYGAVLVFVVLGLFLHGRIAGWVIAGIPVAFLGAFMLMPLPFVDVSINIVSLFGFILVLGIVVDDAIVIAESVYTETEKHGYTLPNIVAGARRVAVPATFGVLTTIMTFLPLLFVSGPARTMAAAIGWVVVLCLIFSLVESKLILPSHLALMNAARTKSGIAERVDAGLHRFIIGVYEPLLRFAIAHRYSTLAAFIALLIIAGGLVASGQVRYVFFPEVDSDFVSADVELADGAPETLIRAVIRHLDDALAEVNRELKGGDGAGNDVIKNDFAYVQDGRRASIRVELEKSERRDVTPQEVEQRWRAKVGEIAGIKTLNFSSTMNMGGGPPVAFKLSGRDYPVLENAADQLVDALRGVDGTFQVESSANAGPEEIQLRLLPEADALGVTLAELARQVRAAFYGTEAQRVQRGDQEVKVMVRFPESERRSIGNLENMWVRTLDGRELPFSAVATFDRDQGYNSIRRVNGERAITVSARIATDVIEPGDVMRLAQRELIPAVIAAHPGVTVDLTGGSREERLALDEILMGFVLALFGIYALMAIPLRSYLQPLIIMGVIPFGIVGAIAGHLLLGISISVISLLGIVALSGVVVNDSLIMVDFVNKEVQAGASEADAAIRSGSARLRPILLTSLTTFFGLAPMVFEQSMQAQMVIPMAVSMAFGILFATVITLVLIPALYVILGDLRALVGLRRAPA
jgi:multidrug efflux pump subunit AcrB